jgi:hypothetical protein
MPEPHPSNPRKRPPSGQRPPVSTKQKLNHPNGYHPPAAFWDNLSKIWLTRRALEEFDRRNTQPTHRSRSDCRVTRRAVAEWKDKKENWEPIQPAADFLTCCSGGCLDEIKLLARHGGPDLSDLRGVCIAGLPALAMLTVLSLVPEAYQPPLQNELEPVHLPASKTSFNIEAKYECHTCYEYQPYHDY